MINVIMFTTNRKKDIVFAANELLQERNMDSEQKKKTTCSQFSLGVNAD